MRRQFIGVYLDSDNVSYDTGAPRASGSRRSRRACTRYGARSNLVVEMSDHLIVLDSPVTDAQSLWLVGQTRAPSRQADPLARVAHHMDHAGGLRGVLAEGAGRWSSARGRARISAACWRRRPLAA